MVRKMNSYLDQLLKIHWLRPETAVWRTFDCLLMEKYGDIKGCSADLGCGDGTMSFIMAGGLLGAYDVFLDVGDVKNYKDGSDIYNQLTDISIESDQRYVRYAFEWGVDHKAGLIDKAKRFHPFYTNNLIFDLNKKLPFESEYLDSAFSNILYWLDDIGGVLSEWNRTIKKNGRIHLFVPNANFKEKAWLFYSAPHLGENKYLNYFDRGYNSLIHHCYTRADWENIFQTNGFEVVGHHPYLTKPVMDIWNIGTRPIASLLINMASKLDHAARSEVKQEWVNYFADFFMPIIDGEFEREVPENETAFHFFVLEKK